MTMPLGPSDRALSVMTGRQREEEEEPRDKEVRDVHVGGGRAAYMKMHVCIAH